MNESATAIKDPFARCNNRLTFRYIFSNHQPTMIAESTPFGGINMNTTNTNTFNQTDPWDRWYEKVIDLIEKYDIDMWSYINCDWESQPMWHNVGFGDTRLSSNDKVMGQWQNTVVNSNGTTQKFLMGGSLQHCSLLPQTKDLQSSFGPLIICLVAIPAIGILATLYASNDRQNCNDPERTPLAGGGERRHRRHLRRARSHNTVC